MKSTRGKPEIEGILNSHCVCQCFNQPNTTDDTEQKYGAEAGADVIVQAHYCYTCQGESEVPLNTINFMRCMRCVTPVPAQEQHQNNWADFLIRADQRFMEMQDEIRAKSAKWQKRESSVRDSEIQEISNLNESLRSIKEKIEPIKSNMSAIQATIEESKRELALCQRKLDELNVMMSQKQRRKNELKLRGPSGVDVQLEQNRLAFEARKKAKAIELGKELKQKVHKNSRWCRRDQMKRGMSIKKNARFSVHTMKVNKEGTMVYNGEFHEQQRLKGTVLRWSHKKGNGHILVPGIQTEFFVNWDDLELGEALNGPCPTHCHRRRKNVKLVHNNVSFRASVDCKDRAIARGVKLLADSGESELFQWWWQCEFCDHGHQFDRQNVPEQIDEVDDYGWGDFD